MDLNWVILGSHKGLGYHLVKRLLKLESTAQVLGFSRQDSGKFKDHEKYKFLSFDFTKVYDDEILFNKIKQTILELSADKLPLKIIYVAGGGPFGDYSSKDWKDHEWAIKLNFLFPAKLIHSLKLLPEIQFLYVGSAIAEDAGGDAYGPSYAASKWAMKGLIASIKKDPKGLHCLHFSPSYMDTEMLPKNSFPRRENLNISDPQEVAAQILSLVIGSH